MPLNEQQHAAVHSRSQHKRISAGPGTGKTHLSVAALTDAHRRGKKITALSFTVAASEELSERFARAIGITDHPYDDREKKPWCKTVNRATGHRFSTADSIIWHHALEHDLITKRHKTEEIKRHPKTGKLLNLQRQIIGHHQLSPSDHKIAEPIFKSLQFGYGISEYAAELEIINYWAETPEPKNKSRLIIPWPLLRWNVMQTPANRFETNQFVLVDEAQDLANLQWKALWHILGHPETDDMETLIIGDECQAIYQFQGAEGILPTFAGSEDHHLTVNYRTANPDLIHAIWLAGQALPQKPPKLQLPANTPGSRKGGIKAWKKGAKTDVLLSYKWKKPSHLVGTGPTSTIHSAKGLEWKSVCYARHELRDSDCPDNLEYVAVSRAKEELIITE